MWHDAASVRIKLKFPAAQRHHHERAVHVHWLAISQVRFLYGLPTYIFLILFVFHFQSPVCVCVCVCVHACAFFFSVLFFYRTWHENLGCFPVSSLLLWIKWEKSEVNLTRFCLTRLQLFRIVCCVTALILSRNWVGHHLWSCLASHS
jgi:hypothetical protein